MPSEWLVQNRSGERNLRVLLNSSSKSCTRNLTEYEAVVSIGDWFSLLRPVWLDANSRGHHSPSRASNESKHISTVERETPGSGPVSRDFGKNRSDGRWRRLSDCPTNPLSRYEASEFRQLRNNDL